ncbi:molybdenum cofactor guanylyltransferase [Arthrobacter gallicola]|uniref:molybdenum cofactor guanylyltransferase n=1 Tax=Arthrobacter gallicola TaxID=2762225 RepID=UPI001CD88A34|nr:NTP transferase domain-containing protein [Arthrobacter gallicola]
MKPQTGTLPVFNAVVLAGGRSSRLGGVPKAGLILEGKTLLERTLDTVRQAGRVAVAGPAELEDVLPAVPAQCFFVREEPAFSGPAAAVGAAVDALCRAGAAEDSVPPWTLVLACDMPGAAGAVQALLAEASSEPGTSLMARDSSGALQPLAALYRTDELRGAVQSRSSVNGHPGGLENLSMFRLLARVQWREVAVPEGSTADVDTWADAGKWGISPGSRAV